MTTLPLQLRLVRGWLEIACACRKQDWVIGHHSRLDGLRATAAIAAAVAHARSCTAGHDAATAAQLEAERLRPAPRITIPRGDTL